MVDSSQKGTSLQGLLKMAGKEAGQGHAEKASELFSACINGYLNKGMPFRALAAAKAARTALKGHPRILAMILRLLASMDLIGEAEKLFTEIGRSLRKDEVPILKHMGMTEFAEILDILEMIRVKKGNCVIKQDERGGDICIVISGTLSVIRDGEVMNTLGPGDVFGELAFFSGHGRTASVRALQACEIAVIPGQALRDLCRRHAGLMNALEGLYLERILRKAGEEVRNNPLIDLKKDILSTCSFSKGQEIVFDSAADITIIKHGVVEVSYDDRGLTRKRFLRPGYIARSLPGQARACTDVEIIRSRIDLLGTQTEDS